MAQRLLRSRHMPATRPAVMTLRMVAALRSIATIGCGSAGGLAADAAADASPSEMDAPSPAEAPAPQGDANSATLPDGACVPRAQIDPPGVCECVSSETPDPCAAGCTDLSIDSESCGTCGHACAPREVCLAGSCGPEPTIVVPSNPGCGSLSLAARAGTVYWTDEGHGTVESQARAGGPPVVIASGESGPTRIKLNGANVFWLASGTSIRTAALTGGTPTGVVSEAGTIADFDVSEDGAFVYYATGTSLRKVASGGGASVEVANVNGSVAGAPVQIAVGGGLLAYRTMNAVDVVTLVDGVDATCGMGNATDSGGSCLAYDGAIDCSRLIYTFCHLDSQFIYLPNGLLLRNGEVYFGYAPTQLIDEYIYAAPASSTAAGPHAIVSLPGQGNTPSMPQPGGLIRDFVGGPTDIYFAASPVVNDPPQAEILRVPYAGGTAPTPMARVAGIPAMAADETGAYWSRVDCAIEGMTVP